MSDFVESETVMCDRMHGFTVEEWEGHIVPRGKEIIRSLKRRGR